MDIRTDLPCYRVSRNGKLIEEPTDILAHWRDDLVAWRLSDDVGSAIAAREGVSSLDLIAPFGAIRARCLRAAGFLDRYDGGHLGSYTSQQATGNCTMLVIARQIKAARSLIGWHQVQLAAKSGVAISTVRRLESSNGPVTAHFGTVEKIRQALEAAGIEFEGNPNSAVRLRCGSMEM